MEHFGGHGGGVHGGGVHGGGFGGYGRGRGGYGGGRGGFVGHPIHPWVRPGYSTNYSSYNYLDYPYTYYSFYPCECYMNEDPLLCAKRRQLYQCQ